MSTSATTLRFHRGLYAASAIDSAVGLYLGHATIARTDEGEHVVLRIESAKSGRAVRVARELANYALGLTIQARGVQTGAPMGESR